MVRTRPIHVMHYTEACCLARCHARGPHDHAICPRCGAVDFGNAYCQTCRATWDIGEQNGDLESRSRFAGG